MRTERSHHWLLAESLGMGMAAPSMAQAEQLRVAEPFDLAFVDAMTAHHTAAIAMARVALSRSARPEITQLARDIISAQQREIDQMRAWRAAWYPDAPPPQMLTESVDLGADGSPSSSVPPSGLVGGQLLEAVDADGWSWRVQAIQAGVSANGNEYPLAVLHAAAPVYDGVPVFCGRGPDHSPDERGFGSVAGYITAPKPNERGVEGVFEISRGRAEVREAIRHAWDVQTRTGRGAVGFSHVVPRGGATLEARRPRGYRVTGITRVESVDIVMQPAAGGSLLAPLAESRAVIPDALQEAIMNVAALLAKLREGKKLSLDELAFLQEAIGGDDFAAAVVESAPAAPAAPTPAPTPAPVATQEPPAPDAALTEALGRVVALEQQAKLAEARALLTSRLAASRLPEAVRTSIAADFDARLFESADLDARIERERAIVAELTAVRPHGLGAVTVTDDQRSRHQQAMDGFFGMPHQGVRGFRSLKEAYVEITGRRFGYDDPDIARAILSEAISYTGNDPLLSEAITSSTFGAIMGDSITRRMLQVYNEPAWQSWRLIVGPNITALSDFRTQRRLRLGGYGDLPVVAEGAPYQPLATGADEQATYQPVKRGGLESLTWEAIRNDDMGAIRRIPIELGIADRATLYHLIWNTIIRDNAATTYDGLTLFHATHGNLGTLPLTAANLLTAENAMRDQRRFGVTDRVMGASNQPKYLVIPNELRDMAFRLTGSSVAVGATNQSSTEPNIFAGAGYVIIVIDDWTDPNDWFLFADPTQLPTIEVGFLDGREDPELFVQDAQNIGSVFTADKVTYKIRHVYGAAAVEHRGAYRNVV